MKKSLVGLVAFSFFFAVPAFAAQYATLKGGPYFPDESEFDTGFNLEAAYGLNVGDIFPGLVENYPGFSKVSAEAGIGYYTADISEKTSFLGQRVSVDGDIDVVPLTLTGIYTQPLENTDFEIYGGVGIGLYLAFSETEMKVNDPVLGPVRQSDDDSEVELGLHLLGGTVYNINQQLGVTAEFKWAFVTDDIGGGFLNFGVRYKF